MLNALKGLSGEEVKKAGSELMEELETLNVNLMVKNLIAAGMELEARDILMKMMKEYGY